VAGGLAVPEDVSALPLEESAPVFVLLSVVLGLSVFASLPGAGPDLSDFPFCA
jgi:hypothetical protein